jgi:hypothetical protein
MEVVAFGAAWRLYFIRSSLENTEPSFFQNSANKKLYVVAARYRFKPTFKHFPDTIILLLK